MGCWGRDTIDLFLKKKKKIKQKTPMQQQNQAVKSVHFNTKYPTHMKKKFSKTIKIILLNNDCE